MYTKENANRMFFLDVITFNRDFTRYIESSMKADMNESVKIGINLRYFLMYINKKEKVTYYQLAQNLPYDSSFISKTLKKLEAMDLIKKQQIGNKKVITLTEEGKRRIIVKEGRKKLFETIENEGISKKELLEFFNTMKKLSEILKLESGLDL